MSENNEDWLESKWCVTCKGATCLPGMHEPTILGGKPSVAACILGAQAVEGKITGRDAAKVFATMLMADAVPVPPGPDYISQINALEAERDALRADAERYRWARQQENASAVYHMIARGECGANMDARIDDARAQS